MTELDWSIQLNPKLPDGTLINIRGNEPKEVLDKLEVLAGESGRMAESLKLITAAGAAVNAAHPQPTPAPAAASTWTPPASAPAAAPAASQPGAAPACVHGARVYKTGEKAGRTWKGWSCIAPKGESCAMQWIN